MPDDRLRHDHDDVEDLKDLIDAREEGSSHFARDIDSSDTDFDIPEDIDVDEALTFPHQRPKPRPTEEIELMGTPKPEQIDIGWAESQEDMLPTDYQVDYDDALTTDLYDEDTVAEEQMDEIGHIESDELSEEEPLTTPLPKRFQPEEEERWEQSPGTED